MRPPDCGPARANITILGSPFSEGLLIIHHFPLDPFDSWDKDNICIRLFGRKPVVYGKAKYDLNITEGWRSDPIIELQPCRKAISMFPSGSEYEHILVGLLVMQLGFILSAIPLLFVSKKARLLQRRDLTRWQKHIPSFIALMIASLIAAFGFSLAIFFFTPLEWVKLLNNFIACFSGYLSICLFFYSYTLFYYHSGLEEQVRKLNQTRR